MSKVVHGCIVASALDEVLTCAASVQASQLSATVGLEVEFLASLAVGGSYEEPAQGTYLDGEDGVGARSRARAVRRYGG